MSELNILFQGDMIRALLNQRPGVWPAEPIDPSKPMKWQTRRIIKPQPPNNVVSLGYWQGRDDDSYAWRYQTRVEIEPGFVWNSMHDIGDCPYGRPGDKLWVRETWATVSAYDHLKPSDIPKGERRWPAVWYDSHPNAAASIRSKKSAGDEFIGKRRPSIFMPRWASRIDLENKRVRVQRIQEISREDAAAEGAYCHHDSLPGYALHNFMELWNSINGRAKPSKRNPYTIKPEECYTSYPWDEYRGTEQYRGKTHYIIGNPWVFAIDLMRLR